MNVPDPRINPLGLWRFGSQFLEAGKLVAAELHTSLPVVAYNLLCHSAELSLKGALAADGVSEAELRTFGHDLKAILARVLERNLVSVPSEHEEVLLELSPLYRAKGFDYLEPGQYSELPELKRVIVVATALSDATKDFCINASGCPPVGYA